MKEHIFDILGIGNREDSYTDLIAHSFTTSPSFRKNVLDMLEMPDYDNWLTRTRLPVAIKSNTGRKKDVPDLLLISKKGNKIVLIESKVHSNEGWGQTQRYASDEFKESLIHYLNRNELLENQTPDIKFFYLTLDGNKPSSNEFKILKYSDIANCIPSNLGNSKRDILLQELKERIDEYYSWQPPTNDEVIIEYLKKAERLVTPYKAFCTMADNLTVGDGGFKKEFYVSANRGCSDIPLCLWYRDAWKGENCFDAKDGSKCHNIHLELQWNTCSDKIDLYLHYETNPYMTQKEFKKLDSKFINEYTATRDGFFDYVKDRNLNGWLMQKYSLRIASANFDKNTIFDELNNRIKKLAFDMSEVIDSWVELND